VIEELSIGVELYVCLSPCRNNDLGEYYSKFMEASDFTSSCTLTATKLRYYTLHYMSLKLR
jgi:hypothetical protein